MSMIENLMSRFGYVKMDPYRRLLLAQAEAGAGKGFGPPPLPQSAPVIIPAPVVEKAVRAARTPRRENVTVTKPHSQPAEKRERAATEEEEWEWRMAIARARHRAG